MSGLTLSFAVTLEFTEEAPLTHRGELTVPNARLGARRAVEAAFRQYPGRHWTSLVVLLQREPAPETREPTGIHGDDDRDDAAPSAAHHVHR